MQNAPRLGFRIEGFASQVTKGGILIRDHLGVSRDYIRHMVFIGE